MKLTKGKISKLYNKKRQTLKKIKTGKTSYKRRTFRQRKVNLARKTLKKFNYKKYKGGLNVNGNWLNNAKEEIEMSRPEAPQQVTLDSEAPEVSEEALEPEPFEPQALEPQALEPQALEPEPFEPQALEPEPFEPQALEPEPFEPQALEPEPFEPQALKPEPFEPQALKPEPFEPQALKPEPFEPQALKPEPFEPQALEPEPFEPQALEPEPFEPQALEPEPFEPQALEPEPFKPQSPEQVTSEPVVEKAKEIPENKEQHQDKTQLIESLTKVIDYVTDNIVKKVSQNIVSFQYEGQTQNGFNSIDNVAKTMAMSGGSKFKKTKRFKFIKNKTRRNIKIIK